MGQLISRELLELFSKYIENHMGLYFPQERAGDLEMALRRAAPELGHEDPEECIRSLLLAPAEGEKIEVLASHLTVGETYFFREEKTFDILKERILPDLIRARRESCRHLRIWSAGCATGEEPYSIAILLHSMLPDFREWIISILATDINPAFLRKAASGIYGQWSFRNTPTMFRERYFRKVAKDRFEVFPDIKKRVSFQLHNLSGDICPSLTNGANGLDIIFCRNVLMYFSRRVQEEVSEKLNKSLVEGGWLAVSPVEMSANLFSSFTRADFPGVSLYKKDSSFYKKDNGKTGRLAVAPPAVPFPPYRNEIFSAEKKAALELRKTAPEAGAIPETKKRLPEAKKNFKEELFPEAGARSGQDAFTQSYQNAVALYRQGKYAEACAQAERLISSGGADTRLLALLARINADQGKLEAALELCEKAIASDKVDPGPYYLLATIQQGMGLPEKSVFSLKQALYLDPDFVLAYFLLGDLARRQGRTDESRKQFENALSAMDGYGQGDLIPESEGLTAGRLIEIINNNMREIARV